MTQIHFSHQLVGENCFSIAFGDQLTVVDDVGCFANVERFTDVVVGDQHANAFGLKVVNDLLDIAHRDGVNACKRFIEQDELGVGRQGGQQ